MNERMYKRTDKEINIQVVTISIIILKMYIRMRINNNENDYRCGYMFLIVLPYNY